MKYFFFLIFLIFINGCSKNSTQNNNSVYAALSTGESYPVSSIGTASYYVTVSDDTILGARIKGTIADANGSSEEIDVCSGFTEIGGGVYSLNDCSTKPTRIASIGGFIDLNNDGKFDTNEPTQDATLKVDTTILSDSNFSITPLSTLAASNMNIDHHSLALKLGFSNEYSAFSSNAETREMNQRMNALLSAATNSGFKTDSFCSDLASYIVLSDSVGIDNIKSSVTTFVNSPIMLAKYGEARIKSFWNDSRVQAVMNDANVMNAMLAKKIPLNRLRINGLVISYPSGSNIIDNATVELMIDGQVVRRGVTDRYGKYAIELAETKILRDHNVTINAKKASMNLHITIPANILLDKRINGQINPNEIDSLILSEHNLSFMGSNTVLIGAQMSNETASAAPFDAKYLYLAGGSAPDSSCMNSCKASSSCGSWWGCWQWDELPPGEYINAHINNASSATWQGSTRAQIPVFTYYLWLNTAKMGEGSAEVTAMNDSTILARYLNDWRFLLQKIGSRRVMIHIEPDLWGYVRAANSNPHAISSPVRTANPTDCSDQENSAAGLARCMISMARKYAPNAAVGLHASPWTYTQNGDAQALSDFMNALGAGEGDFVVTDPSDRDAGWYELQGQSYRWWDDQKASAYLAWSKELSERVGKPTVMWQIPLGNMNQDNTYQHYKDNRVDWLFAHIDEVASSHVVGLFFGSGDTPQTTPETDGGNLINKTTTYWQNGGVLIQ